MITLGFMVTVGNSIQDAQRSGQLQRLLTVFKHYASGFSQIYYFTYDAVETIHDYTSDPFLQQRIKVLPSPNNVRAKLYSLFIPYYWKQYLQKCDVILVGQAVGAIPAIVSRYWFGTPFVPIFGYSYSSFARSHKRMWHAYLIRLVEIIAAKGANMVIARTPELAVDLERFVSKEKIVIIPNGVDTELFSPAAFPPRNDPPVLIFVGRLEPQKNLFALLEASHLLQDELPVRLLMIGEGSLREGLQQKAVELNLNVELLGARPYEQLPNYLQSADAFILPSLIEGHPKALIEAMSVGLPCVGTDTQGIRDLIQDSKTGILCQGTDPISLADGLRRLCADWQKAGKMGKQARTLVESQFSLGILLQKEMTMLRQVAERRAR